MAVEMVLMVPVLVAVLMLIVMLGRYVGVRGDVDAAVRDGARAASLEATPDAARQRAISTVEAALDSGSGSHAHCSTPAVDLSRWGAGGQVAVSMNCRISYSDLSLLPMPGGGRTIHASATVPLDTYRSYY